MAELVGRYYATFYARRGYEELLKSMMKGAEEPWEVSADAARLIRLYAAGGILSGLLKRVDEALKDMATKDSEALSQRR